MDIPVYQPAQTGINLGPTPRADTYPRDERSSSLGPGLAAVSHGLQSVELGQQVQMDALQKQQEQQDLTRTAIAISGAHASLLETMDERKKAIFNDPNGIDPNKFNNLTGEMHEATKKAYQEIADQATTQKGKNLAQVTGASFWADHYMPKSKALQAEAGVDFARSNIQGTIKNFAASAANDPSSAEALIQFTEGSIDQAVNLPWTERQAFKEAARHGIGLSAINRQVMLEPGLFSQGKKRRTTPGVTPGANGSVTDTGGTQTFAVGDEAPIEGTPIQDQQPPPEIAMLMGVLSAKGIRVAWHAETSLLTGKDAENFVPSAIKPAVKPPTEEVRPLTDAEITAKAPMWQYLTFAEKNHYRNLAGTTIDQGSALELHQAKLYVTEAKARAHEGLADLNPKDSTWFDKYFPHDPQVYETYKWDQVGAHMMQMMIGNTNRDNADILALMRTTAESSSAHIATFSRVAALADAFNKPMVSALMKKVTAQEARVLAGNQPGEMLRFDEFKAAGLTQERYGQYLQDFGNWEGVAAMKLTASADISDYLRRVAVQPDTKDANEQMARYNQAVDTANRIAKDRNSDPALAALNSMPELKMLRQKAVESRSPNDWANVFERTKAEQARVSGDPEEYRLLTKGDIAQLDNTINSPVHSGEADTFVARLKQIEKQYGSYFPRIIEEMQMAKVKFPDGAYLSMLHGNNNLPMQAQLAQLDRVPISSFNVPEGTTKLVHAEVDRLMVPFYQSIVEGRSNMVLSSIGKAIAKLAVSDLSRDPSGSPTDAAANAIRSTLDLFKFEPNVGDSRKTMIPISEKPEEVAKGMAVLRRQLPSLTFETPTDLYRDMTKEEASARFQDDLKRNNILLANNNQTGVLLFIKTRDGILYPVRGQNSNKQFGMTFEALREQGMTTQSYAPPSGFRAMPLPRPYVPGM